MKIEINLNDTVEVTLTEKGAEVYNKYLEGSYMYRQGLREQKKAGDVLKEQLWHMFQVFGPHIHLGNQAPFDLCEIRLKRDTA